MQALIEEMNALISKIKTGTATLGELEAFAAAAQQVNERAIILRYKAIEAKVYGEESTPIMEIQPESIPELEVEKSPVSIPEIKFEHVESSFEFDLFGSDKASQEKEEVEIEAEKINDESPEENEAPLFEPVLETEKIKEELTENSLETSLQVEQNEPEITEKPTEQPVFISEETEHPIYTKLNPNDTSLAARLMAVRIDSLSSAFGFNERMQVIQELFNGSNDEFNATVKTLDELNSKNEARSVVSQTAHAYNWDIDNLLALEFIQKVERRYA